MHVGDVDVGVGALVPVADHPGPVVVADDEHVAAGGTSTVWSSSITIRGLAERPTSVPPTLWPAPGS